MRCINGTGTKSGGPDKVTGPDKEYGNVAKIEFGRELKFKKVLTVRKKIAPEEIPVELQNVERFIEEMNLKKMGPLITAVAELDFDNGSRPIELEIVIPVDRGFAPRQGYEFRDVFHVKRAVRLRFRDKLEYLQSAYRAIQVRLRGKNLRPAGSFYNVYIDEMTQGRLTENAAIDVYLEVKPAE